MELDTSFSASSTRFGVERSVVSPLESTYRLNRIRRLTRTYYVDLAPPELIEPRILSGGVGDVTVLSRARPFLLMTGDLTQEAVIKHNTTRHS
jgi:hypothetical protein